MTLRVHILREPEATHLTHLKGKLTGKVSLTTGPTLPNSNDVLVAGRPSADQLKKTATLIIPFAGVPQETRKLLLDFPRPVHNLHHNAGATAEMAMSLLLAAAKRTVPVDRAFRKGDWSYRYDASYSVLLDGRSAVIVGFGSVGSRVGRACRALGMNVTGVRRSNAGSLRGLLPGADVLVICVPETSETEGMIGATELALLPPGAILVNMARGSVVNEDALYEALKSGRLGSAGLDVWYSYPKGPDQASNHPPSRHPFGELDNVVMSPHRGGDFGNEAVERLRMEHLADLINRAAEGAPIPNPVDVERGY